MKNTSQLYGDYFINHEIRIFQSRFLNVDHVAVSSSFVIMTTQRRHPKSFHLLKSKKFRLGQSRGSMPCVRSYFWSLRGKFTVEILLDIFFRCGYPGWWQLEDFLCSPRKLGKMNPIWRAYFSKGLKPPTSINWKHLWWKLDDHPQ